MTPEQQEQAKLLNQYVRFTWGRASRASKLVGECIRMVAVCPDAKLDYDSAEFLANLRHNYRNEIRDGGGPRCECAKCRGRR